MKNCRIRHTYGEDEDVDDNRSEEEAAMLAEQALACYTVPACNTVPAVEAPERAVVTIGGAKCKWCGSSTHSRKNHKDCPYNPNNKPNSS